MIKMDEVTKVELQSTLDALLGLGVKVMEIDTFKSFTGEEGIEIVLDEKSEDTMGDINHITKIGRLYLITKRSNYRLSLINQAYYQKQEKEAEEEFEKFRKEKLN